MQRSVFVQPASLSTTELERIITKLKGDSAVQHIVADAWDEFRVPLIKNLIPWNPAGPYKHLFIGNPRPTTYDYRAILDDTWRWNNLEAAEVGAKAAWPYADGWYINYETGLNVFESSTFATPWEWYLGDMVKRLIKYKNVPIIWSPYLIGTPTPARIAGIAQVYRAIKSWYAPNADFQLHVQDGVGSGLQTPEGALAWFRALRTAGVPLKVNVEWFAAQDDQFVAANGLPREQLYAANGFEPGALWEARYYDSVGNLNFPLYQFHAYDSVGKVCSGKAQYGTKNLLAAINGQWDQSMSFGIYNCRPNSGNTSILSIHAEGRAVDVGFSGVANPQGTELLHVLLRNAWPLGLQYIIWNRKKYSRQYPLGATYYGPNPHTDHLHIEQTWDGALTLDIGTAWYHARRG